MVHPVCILVREHLERLRDGREGGDPPDVIFAIPPVTKASEADRCSRSRRLCTIIILKRRIHLSVLAIGKSTVMTNTAISRAMMTATATEQRSPSSCMRRPIENNSSPGQAIHESFGKSARGRKWHVSSVANVLSRAAKRHYFGQIGEHDRLNWP